MAKEGALGTECVKCFELRVAPHSFNYCKNVSTREEKGISVGFSTGP